MDMSTSELVDRALDGILRRGLGNGPVRAERNLEVGDVASANVVDETYREPEEDRKRVNLIGNKKFQKREERFDSP